MNSSDAHAVLDEAREYGLALGPTPDRVSEAWYDAWRFVLRQNARRPAIYSNLAVPPTLMPWEREVVMPAALDALDALLDAPDLEVPNDDGSDGHGGRS